MLLRSPGPISPDTYSGHIRRRALCPNRLRNGMSQRSSSSRQSDILPTTQLVETLAEAERLLPIAFVGDDGLGSALVQLLSQFGAVVGFVAEHAFRGLGSADQALGYRAIVRFTAGQ